MEELSAIPVWLCIPFAGLLLSIAVMPLIKPDWWEKHQPLAVAFWSVLFIVPFAASPFFLLVLLYAADVVFMMCKYSHLCFQKLIRYNKKQGR